MKNKKGFTLVEIIVVIAILVVIAGIFSVNMIRTMNKNKEEENKNVVAQITSAAETYVSTNPEKIAKLYEGYGYVDIPIGDLRDAGLLSEDIKDAATGTRIDDKKLVRVSLQTGDYVTTKYPLTEEEKTQTTYSLVAEDLNIKYDSNTNTSTWCNNNNNVFYGMFDKRIYTTSSYASVMSKLYIMDNAEENKGAIFQDNYLEAPTNLQKISCNVNPQVAGTYTINYKFTDPEIGTEKTATRNVYVRTNDSDIISFTAAINDGKPLTLNAKNVKIVIKEKKRDGTINEITTTIERLIERLDYSIDNFYTTSAGSRIAVVKTKKTNSDGSTPSPANAPYTLTDSFLKIIQNQFPTLTSCSSTSTCYLTCGQSNNYVKYNGHVYRMYAKTGNDIHLIYNGTEIIKPYGQLGDCTNNSCCNGGRYYYNKLGGNSKGIGETMDDVLNSFYTSKGVYSGKLKSQSTPYGSKPVGLLSKSEYMSISKNGSCPNNYLTGTSFWLVDAANYDRGEGNYNEGRNAASAKDYAVDASGKIITAGAEKPKTWKEDYGTSHITTDRLAVRPTIMLNNPKYKSGSGTSSDPYEIKG